MKKILIIDDEESLCEEISFYFKEIGYDTAYATSGKEGLEIIGKGAPNLLILDIRMPGMDGLEVMRELIARFPNLVVVVLSGVLDADVTRKAIENGAAECIAKPITMEELHERVVDRLIGKP